MEVRQSQEVKLHAFTVEPRPRGQLNIMADLVPFSGNIHSSGPSVLTGDPSIWPSMHSGWPGPGARITSLSSFLPSRHFISGPAAPNEAHEVYRQIR